MHDSYMLSPYYKMFVEMGFPQLDIRVFKDGEWAIREFHNAPLVPSLTKWKYVLSGMRNIEISESFIRKYLWSIDPRQKRFWEHDDETRKKEDEERAYYENERAERTMALGKQLAKNEDLMNEAYRIGPAAFDLENIAKKIYKERPWKLKDL